MSDWIDLELINIALRFALYLDLMVLFGLAAFGLYSLRGKERRSGEVLDFEPLLLATAGLGLLLSLAAMYCMARIMSGAEEWEVLWPHIAMMVLETDVGSSGVLRLAALIFAGMAALLNTRWPRVSLGLVTLAGTVALATLAWAGHGAMDEGERRTWHLLIDCLHLWAAGGWVGALAAFALLLRQAEQRQAILARSLKGFEQAGAVIVITLSVTGVANYLLILGPTLTGLLDSRYGQLLMLKLVLFAAMLALAARNRFRLGPSLEHAREGGEQGVAVRALRRSMTLEFAAAMLILGLVAWLGTLGPGTD